MPWWVLRSVLFWFMCVHVFPFNTRCFRQGWNKSCASEYAKALINVFDGVWFSSGWDDQICKRNSKCGEDWPFWYKEYEDCCFDFSQIKFWYLTMPKWPRFSFFMDEQCESMLMNLNWFSESHLEIFISLFQSLAKLPFSLRSLP